jgi:hypothetical protein
MPGERETEMKSKTFVTIEKASEIRMRCTDMPTNSEAFHEMLANNRLYGTVLRENGTMQLWWLPTFANSPTDCLNAQRWAWVNLGTEEQKHLLSLVGSFPGWPGEYDYFGEYPRFVN